MASTTSSRPTTTTRRFSEPFTTWSQGSGGGGGCGGTRSSRHPAPRNSRKHFYRSYCDESASFSFVKPNNKNKDGKRRRTVSQTWIRIIICAILLPSLFSKDSSSSSSTKSTTKSPFYIGRVIDGRKKMNHHGELIQRGHSHNDYHQLDPLFSSLRHGIKSIEVDVFPKENDLWVAHTIFELDPQRTIGNLYIQPLLSMFRRAKIVEDSASLHREEDDPHYLFQPNRPIWPRGRGSKLQGSLVNHPNNDDTKDHNPPDHLMNFESGVIHLLVDLKGNAERSVQLLQQAVHPLKPYLSKIDKKGHFHQGKITILVSGNRPKDTTSLLHSNGERFLFLDGRQGDLKANTDTRLVPMVSLPWRQLQLSHVFGRSEQHMRTIVERAHEQGKRIRIWGAPNREDVWLSMVNSNIDLVGVDDHPKYFQFASTVSKQSK